MSLAIKLLVLFFIIDLSVAKYITNKDSIVRQDNQDVYMSHIDYSNFFKQKIEGWQREADERYPSWTNSNNKGHLDSSFFLQGEAQNYLRHWKELKNRKGYPYADLQKKIGVLWPHQVGTCPEFEAPHLLTYIMHGLSRHG
ncbi:hypothetical protein Bca4012_080636 [Brassica carinata]